MSRCRLPLLTAILALLLGACGRSFLNLTEDLPSFPAEAVALDLYLIGDAGLPAPGGEPVLQALQAAIGASAAPSLVVYLGDNLYPAGLPDSTSHYREEAERILDAQLAVLRESGTPGIFIPGNHDWAAGAPSGWETVVRQELYVERHGAGLATFLPDGGCPGPVVVDVEDAVRLVVLDTQWWLQRGPKPIGPDSPCGADTPEEIVDSLRAVLAGSGARPVIVLGHHPIISAGEHGGYFDWPSYLVPFYPWARQVGFGPQDVAHPRYRRLRRALIDAFSERKPLLYAAGHDHNLQVLAREPAHYLLVSGGGFFGHTTPVRAITGTRYVRRSSGFARVTLLRDGRVRLGVFTADGSGQAREDFSMWLAGEGK